MSTHLFNIGLNPIKGIERFYREVNGTVFEGENPIKGIESALG